MTHTPKQKNFYPAFILLILGSFICFLVWSALRAADAGPEVTDADYYSKGLRYTSTLLEKKAADVLGWQVTTRKDSDSLEFYLHDRSGAPVSKASGTLLIYRPSKDASVRLPLTETAPGRYRLELTSEMSGEMSARLEFERDGARLNRQLLLNL